VLLGYDGTGESRRTSAAGSRCGTPTPGRRDGKRMFNEGQGAYTMPRAAPRTSCANIVGDNTGCWECPRTSRPTRDRALERRCPLVTRFKRHGNNEWWRAPYDEGPGEKGKRHEKSSSNWTHYRASGPSVSLSARLFRSSPPAPR